MSRQRTEPRIYHNQKLMDETNDIFIRVKTHLFDLGNDDFKRLNPKPSVNELDEIMHRIFIELQKESEPMIKR